MKKRVCVCTSYAADREPRAPRHAQAIWESGICSDLTFVDAGPLGSEKVQVRFLGAIPGIDWLRHFYPVRAEAPLGRLKNEIVRQFARRWYQLGGGVSNSALTPNLRGFERLIAKNLPQIIVAHNVDTLLPAYRVAKKLGAKLIFDSMEFHSDMGGEQDSVIVKLIAEIERLCLPQCEMILASSQHVARALEEAYGVSNVIPLYNTPAKVDAINLNKVQGFALYWRNSSIDLGQRGLEEAVRGLAILPRPITLHLQGRLSASGRESIDSLAGKVNVKDRVFFHPPYQPEMAVAEASRFHVGLCLERPGIRNHELTVSNKMFDYHMAGLPVVTSDMPALKSVIERSKGGLCFRSPDYIDFARVVLTLYEDTELYKRLASNARKFAMLEGNLDHDMEIFKAALLTQFGLIR